MEKIEIKIGVDGAVDLQLAGFEGGKCLEVTKLLENLLGNEIVERKMTSEFYLTETIEQESKISSS
ncbi:MAG: DUF2997 domain-containing protein [Deltaproteobacteria bacterium]|nr:DUF2997 domain-containing protein [Deltaproteobacteria bacterium]